MNSLNRGDSNVRNPNQVMVPKPRIPTANYNPRYVYIPAQSNFAPVQNCPNNVPVIQTQQLSNQNSITNKLCKFFMNLLELEKDQGRYDESVAIIQRYINKEINVEELGQQLKGNASRAALPESLITSLKSNIDDLRREMFFGRVKIDRINPPPESVIDMNISTANTMVSSTTVNLPPRLATPQLVQQRPNLYQQQPTNVVARPAQPQTLAVASPQIIRQIAPPNATRPTRLVSNNTVAVFTPQPSVNVSNANLRSIAPSSPIRQPIQNVSASTIRTVSTAALTNVKPSCPIKTEDYKTDTATPVTDNGHKPPIESNCNSVTLPTNIVNHVNYRNKINEVFKTDTSSSVQISEEALTYISEAIENFSISLLEQAAAFACHRQEMFVNDPIYQKIDDVRSQMKYLQDYEDYQRASEEERQKAELFKAAKSRSKTDNQEQQKIKETVRKMQEHDKNCDEYSRANMTALKAIGSKRKLFETDEQTGNMHQPGVKSGRQFMTRPGSGCVNMGEYGGGGGGSGGGVPGSQIYINANYVTGNKQQARNVPMASRQRNKRIILKDFQLVLDQDVKLKRFKTFKKIFMFGRY